MEKITSLAYNNKRIASIDYLYGKKGEKWRESKLDFNFIIENESAKTTDLQALKNQVIFPKFNSFKDSFLVQFIECKSFSKLKKLYKEADSIDNGDKVIHKKSGYKNIDSSCQYLYIQDVERFVNKYNRYQILCYLNCLDDLQNFNINDIGLLVINLVNDSYTIEDMTSDMKKYVGVTITNKKASEKQANIEKQKSNKQVA